ncbi:MAG: class I SAM-dependent methyltransferase [Candidatus Eremiobacteraeota bacterium]|nr:class I SAM-dependent methyltransferase [Candidatus Eremiobacteraeota bacterium]MCW5871295.1 class I SAM-dependent methyltransferase [Candidatus Eremiobacteraeota bacterium]
MSLLLKAMEWVWPGDFLVRRAIRGLNRARLRELRQGGLEGQLRRKQALLEQLRSSPLAVVPEQANEQHYEVPAAFFEAMLGPHLKYSSGYWPDGVASLEASELAMLELYLERAQLQDGQRILDLGCGWGSLSLFLAERFPTSRLLGVSNSASQRAFILGRAAERGLTNLEIWTCDINHLELPAAEFDRIVSVEMLEHVRNYAAVFQLLSRALKPDGKLFVHVFAHREHAYTFEPRGQGGVAGDWMEREFFSGGTMPSLDLLAHFCGPLRVEAQWAVSGAHYRRTADAWLAQMRRRRALVVPLLRRTYGRSWRRTWLGWQLFLLACSELFGYQHGQQWCVHHLRFSPVPADALPETRATGPDHAARR